MYLFLIIFAWLFLAWCFKEWENRYYVGDELIEARKYMERNIFKTPYRKLYRPPFFSKKEFDIYLCDSVDRFRKVCKYKMVDLDDYDLHMEDLKQKEKK